MKPPAEVNLRISHKLIEHKVQTLKEEILNEQQVFIWNLNYNKDIGIFHTHNKLVLCLIMAYSCLQSTYKNLNKKLLHAFLPVS